MAFPKFFRDPIFLSISSGVLLFLAYPPFSFGFAAWFALIPFFASIEQSKSRGEAFFFGYLAGLIFFFEGIQWLHYVTSVGALLLMAFEALFIGWFGLLIYEGRQVKNTFLSLIWVSSAWVFTEFLRVKVPVLGFGWNLLGNSQSDYGIILQSANTLGAYGLSFILIFANACFYNLFSRQHKSKKSTAIFLGLLVCAVFSHGIYHLRQAGEKKGEIRISVIQGNIPQSVKWEVIARDRILEIYSSLTELASYDQPSLILWPEAAFPGYFNRDRDAQKIKDLIAKLEIPVLVGAPHAGEGDSAFNSAYLVGPDGEVKQRYDKQNLVPFGEYVPLSWALGWLKPYAYSLGVSDFSAGHEMTVFEILNKEFLFSSLICFEDTFPELSRQFVNRGAEFLTVITNDAWFGETGAAAQHLQASIFRAVENGVPVVRAANTGISAFISNRGKVLGRVEDKNHKALFVAGQKTMALPVENKETFFRKGGWLFPYFISGLFVIMFFLNNIGARGEGKE